MTAVDTNLVVRLLTGDHPVQAEKARTVFAKENVFIPETVMLETEWVLRYAYEFSAEAIHGSFIKLCGLPNVTLPNPGRMLTALEWYSEGLDFADALNLAAGQECQTLLTFDRKFVKKATGRGACRVSEP